MNPTSTQDDTKQNQITLTLNTIKNVFTNDFYDVSLIRNETHQTYSINIKNTTENCITITFDYNNQLIFIDYLSKCGNITGTQLLQKIDNLVSELNKTSSSQTKPAFKSVELFDDSTIHFSYPIYPDVSVKLSTFKILTTGESWYNSMGYKSNDYDNEKTHNASIRLQPLNVFLKTKLQPYVDKEINKLAKMRDEMKIESINISKTLGNHAGSTAQYPNDKLRYEQLRDEQQRICEKIMFLKNNNAVSIESQHTQLVNNVTQFIDVNKQLQLSKLSGIVNQLNIEFPISEYIIKLNVIIQELTQLANTPAVAQTKPSKAYRAQESIYNANVSVRNETIYSVHKYLSILIRVIDPHIQYNEILKKSFNSNSGSENTDITGIDLSSNVNDENDENIRLSPPCNSGCSNGACGLSKNPPDGGNKTRKNRNKKRRHSLHTIKPARLRYSRRNDVRSFVGELHNRRRRSFSHNNKLFQKNHSRVRRMKTKRINVWT
jgi:hypothetical protein